jgi:hypothetical protein
VSRIRTFARVVLNSLVKHSADETRSWGVAMLREMDFVESDWSALLWALGSARALCTLSVSQQWNAFLEGARRELSARALARRIPAMMLGIIMAAGILSLCMMALARLSHTLWLGPAYYKIADRFLFVIVPEAIYLISAAALWRQRKAIAVGILSAGGILIAHVIVHFATHG